jgi:leader peptidase (prepilin peptidase)/N-methyltransferase
MSLLILAFVFAFGAMIGSFLNVCIVRLPLDESIAFPSSHCRACKAPVAWHDNVPVVSWFALGGKCRHCKAKFSGKYPAVEFLTGCLFVLFVLTFGLTAKSAVYLVFSLALLVQTMIDFEHEIIPDVITLPGIVLGFAASFALPELHGQTSRLAALGQSGLGILVGGGSLWAAGAIAERIIKKEAMGGGDVKLLAMVGALTGWPGVLWTIFVSSLFGSVVGIYLRVTAGKERIPFGPYLGLAAFLYLFFGVRAMEWYFRYLTSV